MKNILKDILDFISLSGIHLKERFAVKLSRPHGTFWKRLDPVVTDELMNVQESFVLPRLRSPPIRIAINLKFRQYISQQDIYP